MRDVPYGAFAAEHWDRDVLSDAASWYPGLETWMSSRNGETLACGMPAGTPPENMPLKAGENMDEYHVHWWLNLRTGELLMREAIVRRVPGRGPFISVGIDQPKDAA